MFTLLKDSILKDNEQKNTIAVLDGVRAIACLLVISFHINLRTLEWHLWQPSIGPLSSALAMTGNTGVTLFFVLSGLLLFMPYARALLFGTSWPSMRNFYIRRAFRILPGYYISLCLIVLFLQPQYLQPAHWQELGLFLIFFMDSAPTTYKQLNGPFWTLAVEWQYYLLLPFLALAFQKIVNRIGGASQQKRWWTLVSCLAALIAWGIFSRYWGDFFMVHPSATFLVPRPIFNVALFFLYGMSGKYLESFGVGMFIGSCYVLAQGVDKEKALKQFSAGIYRSSLWLWGAGIIVLLIMTMWNGNNWFPHSIPIFDHAPPLYDWLSEFGFALGYGLCVLAILFGPASLKLPFAWAPLRWLGMLSYSLYIWHLPIITQFSIYIKFLAGQWNNTLMYSLFWLCIIVVVVPFCYLFFKLVERPWMRKSSKILTKKIEDKQAERALEKSAP